MKRLIKKSLYKIFVSLFVIFYSLVPQSIAIGQVIDEYSQGSAAPIEEEIIPEESLLEEEVVLPEEELPPVVEQPLVEEIPIEEPVIEVPIVEEPVVEETTIEEPVVEPIEVIKEVMSYPVWVINRDTATTYDVVELGETYIAPQNSKVRVIFTKLPENPTKLTIEEITLTQEEIEATGAVSDKAYDIKTDMIDGTFEYDLTLPSEEENTKVVYVENRSEILSDIKEITNEIVNEKDDTIKVKGLDHFTLFIPTGGVVLTVSGSVNGVTQVTVEPSDVITVDITVQRSGDWGENNWESTSWRINEGSWNCVNTTDHTFGSGTDTESFNITAPGTVGTYSISFRAHRNGSCGETGVSNTFTLTNGIIVQSAASANVCNNEEDSYSLNSSGGIWTSVSGGSNINGLNTNEVKWGNSTGYGQSGLRFDSVGTQTFNENTKFLLGTLTHKNWPINNAANGATLQIKLSFSEPAIPDKTFSYYFDIEETTNTYGTCPSWQQTSTPCDDKITFPNSYGSEVITINDIQYTLVIDGFVNSYSCGVIGSVLNFFITEEQKNNSAYLVGHLSSVLVEKPEIRITKKTNDQDISAAPGENLYIGDPVEWQYVVQNSGNVTLTNISLTDSDLGTITCPFTELAKGNSMTCTATGTVTAGQYENTATAIGTTPIGTSVSASDTSWYYGISKKGHLIVQKITVPSGDQTQFTTYLKDSAGSQIDTGIITDSLDKDYEIDAGTYSVDEGIIDGWAQTRNTCNNVTVAAGGTTYCTITNTKYGSLTIVKNANPHSSQSFGFTTSGSGLSSFSLSDDGIAGSSNSKIFKNLLPGTYSAAESSVDGWDLNSVTCNDGSLNTAIDLSAGENITCTFTNLMRGSIAGHKYNDADGDIATTDDRTNIEGWTIELLQDGNTIASTTTTATGYSFSNLKPGTYQLRESRQVGWIKLYPTSNELDVTLSPGENDLNNDFINTRYASITVYKNVDTDGDGNIDITNSSDWTYDITGKSDNQTGTTVSNLAPGKYTISEDQKDGYSVTSLICNNSPVGATDNNYGAVESKEITLSSGQNLVCTFTNTHKIGTLKIVKNLINDNGGALSNSNFSFKVNGGADEFFEPDGINEKIVPTGKYTIVENSVNGYATTYNNCIDVEVSPNEITTCTITNDDIAPKLTVVKNVINDNGGNAVVEDFEIKIGDSLLTFGEGVINGTTTTYTSISIVSSNTSYFLSEKDHARYSEGTWNCVDDITGSEVENPVLLKEGQSVTCTITNDDLYGSDVKICKVDNKQRAQEDWDVVLASEIVESPTSINVSDGNGTNSSNLPAGKYLIKVSGTYRYGNSSMNADAGFSYRPLNIPSGCNCWLSGFDLSGGPNGLMALINGNPVNWGTYNESHVYTYVYDHSSGGAINISIKDDVYGDNVNNNNFQFEVYKISDGYNGTTGEDGCVTLKNIQYGDYLLDEFLKEGWTNISGKGNLVSVDSPEESFTLVNRIDSPVEIVATKIVCTDEKELPNWGNGGENIGKNTATDWVNSHPSCRLESDWSFQWGDDGDINTSDSYIGEVAGWNTFGPTNSNGTAVVKINDFGSTSQIKVREVLKENYIPFTYLTNGNNSNNVSAEIYCDTDVLNYDNDDRITPEYGQTYYCVAWNVRDTGSIKVNKYTDINGDGDWSDKNEKDNANANTLGFKWSIDDVGANDMGVTVSDIFTGKHFVNEVIPSGYHFVSWYISGTGKSCSNPDGTTLPISLDVTKGNTTEITLCNARDMGTVTIIKDSINDSYQNFYFDTNFPSGDFELRDDGNIHNGGIPEKRTFTIPTGSYWIQERGRSGWKLTNLVCIGDGNSVVNQSTGKVDIDLDYGENITCTYTNTQLAKIWGYKYHDENGNGNWNLKEWGLSNWRIFLDEGNGKYDGTEISTLTSNFLLSRGYYEFNDLLPGTYSVCEELQTGWINTTPLCRTVTLTPGDVDGLINFSNFKKGDMTVWKYEDTDGVLGRTDGEESYIGDPTFAFRVYKDNGGTWSFITESSTDGSGEAVFTDVFETVGNYYVCEVKQDGWQEMRSISNPSNNLSGQIDEYPVCEGITVSTSGYHVSTEFGNARLTDIHGYKWSDLNGNGVRDCIIEEEEGDELLFEVCELEPLLSNWTINLFKWNGEDYDSEPFKTMDTDNSIDHYGWYWFEDLMPGKYKICEVLQENWVQTYPLNEVGNCHFITLPDDNPNGFPQQVNAVAGPTYNFGNLQKGKITVYKFNDLNANGVLDEGEPYLSDWEMNMSKDEDEDYSQITGIDGSTEFNLLPDSYVLSETTKDGWDQTNIYCEDTRRGVKITLPECAYGHHGNCSGWNSCGNAATCAQKACEANGYQYLVSYGDQRPCTQFNNCSLFYNIYGDLSYEANWGNWCEVMGVTDIYCSNESQDARAILAFNSKIGVYNDNAYSFSISAGDNKSCYVGNVQRSELYISKTNDSWPNTLAIGDTVTYTIKVRAEKSSVNNVILIDLPPEGFIPQSGTFRAISNVRGILDISAVKYSSPGKWELGKILVGEIVTITYKALVTDLVDAGKYPDLAYAKGIGIMGSNLLAISEGSGFEINDGIVGKYFVGTQVKVENDPEIEEGEVLGAAITLPRTGADTYITLGALISMILGFILLVFNPKKRIKNLFIAGVVLFSMFFILKPLPTYASVADIDVRIEQPVTPTNKNTFKIGFVALDLQNRTVTVECYKDGILFGTYATNSGNCEVTPALVTTSGTYDFYVKAKAGGDENISSTVSVEVVLEKPLPVINYAKTEGTCKYTLSFKTANDGRTSKVEIFRSSTQPFTANASTLIHTETVGPNTPVTYTDSSITDCAKEYYYAIRSIDDYNNVSTLVTDNIVTIVTTPATITPTPIEGNEEEGEVAGEETTPEKEQEQGEVKGEEEKETENGEEGGEKDNENSAKSIWSNYKYFIIAVLVVALGSGAYKYVRRKK